MRITYTKAVLGFVVLASASALFYNARAGHFAKAGEAKTVAAHGAAVLGRPFRVDIGQSTAIPAHKLDVGFERVLEDSRCPKDVNCVWAGQISVVVGLKKAGKPLGTTKLMLLGSNHATPESVGVIGDYGIKLLEAAPERETDSADTAKRVKLMVQDKPFAAPKNEK